MGYFVLLISGLLEGEASNVGTADCWHNIALEQRKRCCSQDSEVCFDEVFTKAECCSNGWAWRFPLPLLEPLNLSAAFQWFQGTRSPVTPVHPIHPALDLRQLKWEEAMGVASKMMRQRILGHDVGIHYFKMATDVAMELADYRNDSDPYALKSLGLEGNLHPSPIFVDVGANLGLVSISLAKQWPSARILAVEPAPATFRYLLWNLKENQVASQVWPINLAISTDSSLRLSTTAAGGVWTARVRPDARPAAGSDYIFDAPAASLAEIVASLGLGAIDLLKIDCEGCEWDILARWDFLSHLFGHVSVELHNRSFVDLVGMEEKRRVELEAQVLNSQLCRIKEEDPAGVKCRSYGA